MAGRDPRSEKQRAGPLVMDLADLPGSGGVAGLADIEDVLVAVDGRSARP
jgi:hypothetical protein